MMSNPPLMSDTPFNGLGGIRLLSPSEANSVDLGPLQQLTGTWVGNPGDGWNVIAVPDTKGFILEIIPYQETLTFSPIVIAGNRGPFVNGNEEVQNITGLLYQQSITSVCDTESCSERGFPSGTEIHAETGIFLYLQNFNSGFNIARLSTIPHGNSVLALGTSSTNSPAPPNFIPDISTIPFPNPHPGLAGYFDPYTYPTFPDFSQSNPNIFLRDTLGGSQVTNLTTLDFSTKNGDGGILNIPFIQQNINTTFMSSTFWIEQIEGSNDLQLQYSQIMYLDFPPTGSNVLVTWPHATINTLHKQPS